jgi:hypothetical protein
VIEKTPDGVFLYRFDAKGGFAGDTWHMSVDDAKSQASFEFETTMSDWREIPPSIESCNLSDLLSIRS